MGIAAKDLSADHARALIKQAIGMINGDAAIEAEAKAEIAAIQARHAARHPKPEPRPKPHRGARPPKVPKPDPA